jgi:phage regulator Rha-like protein
MESTLHGVQPGIVTPIQVATGGYETTTATRSISTIDSDGSDLVLTTTTTEARIDTRLLAQGFCNKHRHSLRLVEHYFDRFERLGKVSFKNAPSPGSKTGQSERFALLNEDQAYLLLSLSRNSDAVVNLKVKLVKAFGMARRAADLRKTEYLPGYHDLHDIMRVLAAGSTNERRVHQNVNRLLNKFAGIESGQRASAALPSQALLIVGQLVASKTAHGASDHHDGYQRIKSSLQALLGTLALEVAEHE